MLRSDIPEECDHGALILFLEARVANRTPLSKKRGLFYLAQ